MLYPVDGEWTPAICLHPECAVGAASAVSTEAIEPAGKLISKKQQALFVWGGQVTQRLSGSVGNQDSRAHRFGGFDCICRHHRRRRAVLPCRRYLFGPGFASTFRALASRGPFPMRSLEPGRDLVFD